MSCDSPVTHVLDSSEQDSTSRAVLRRLMAISLGPMTEALLIGAPWNVCRSSDRCCRDRLGDARLATKGWPGPSSFMRWLARALAGFREHGDSLCKPGPQAITLDAQVVGGLEIEPEPLRGAEEAGEPEEGGLTTCLAAARRSSRPPNTAGSPALRVRWGTIWGRAPCSRLRPHPQGPRPCPPGQEPGHASWA